MIANFGAETEILCLATESNQSWTLWTLMSVESLPLQNLLPSVFIITIMNFDNRLHLFWIWVLVLPTPTY